MNRIKAKVRFVALGVLLIVGFDFWLTSNREPRDLEVDISRSTATSLLQVYFDTGAGYSEALSVTAPLAAGTALQHLDLPLPAAPLRGLRLDPLMTEGTVVIAAVKVVGRSSHHLEAQLDLHHVTPLHEIAQLVVEPNGGGLEISTVPGSLDPSCSLPLDNVPESGKTTAQLFRLILFYDVALIVVCLLAYAVFRYVIKLSPVAWWYSRPDSSRAALGRWLKPVGMLIAAGLFFYVWALMLNLGRSPITSQQEDSWVAVMTYAIANHWQFGKDIVLTYGPLMPLAMCSYIGSIDTSVFVGRMVYEAWSLVLMIWLGLQLNPIRRFVLWAAAVALGAGCLDQPYYYFTVVAAGLLLARGSRASRWLLVPTMVYLAVISLVKVSFLTFALLMLAAVVLDRCRRRQWLPALVTMLSFFACLLAAWFLCGQSLANLPRYLRGFSELAAGFSQAMSLPPAPDVLQAALVLAAFSVLHLGCLFFAARPRQWIDHLPLLGLLVGGLLLAWKAGSARADGHMLDWFVYAMISAAAAPAFLATKRPMIIRWLDVGCVLGVFVAGWIGLMDLNPQTGSNVAAVFRDRWRTNLHFVLHPRSLAQAQKQSVIQNRALYALPQVRNTVGQATVDVFCDEQGIAILNGLNYRPRPSFVSYSTYTAWLMDLDLAFYCSPEAPEYVLFRLESIDNRLPTIQNAPLLIILEKFYQRLFTENGFVLFRRSAQPNLSAAPASFAMASQGDFKLSEPLSLPTTDPLWCELELHETLAGKLLKSFFQQPRLDVEVTYEGGTTGTYRLIPPLNSTGFLINPLPLDTDGYLRWIAGQPSPTVRSIRVVPQPAAVAVFAPQAQYRFYRVPVP